MAAKYFVWGEGVWREVDVASGRVSGWRRRARFVFLRRGRLLVARRRPVLRALEALAKGQPSAAADGRRLAHRSKSESRAHRHEPPPPAPAAPPACAHQHHCCVHNGCLQHERRREAATQSARDAATCTEPAYTLSVSHAPPPPPPAPAPFHSSADEFVSPRPRARGADDVSVLLSRTPPGTGKKRTPGDEGAQRARTAASSDKSDSTSADEPLQRRARRSSYHQGPAVCKELIVSEADIAALRGFVSRTRPSALYRFDADDDYKRALFYAINPLVELERCARLERLLSSRSAAALPHFAARLGLAPRSDSSAAPSPSPARAPRIAARPGPMRYRERSGSSDTDKENKEKQSSQNKERSEPLGVTKQVPRATGRDDKLDKNVAVMKAPLTNGVASDSLKAKRPAAAAPGQSKKAARESEDSGVAPSVSEVPRPPPVGTHVISKRASRANVKEYSNLEDHAIVAWVSAGARASLVGGNRVWRELQEQYERLTGRARSWHSLRNRYLRYILPALGALQLPPADVSRLRAAAATGSIKRHDRAPAPARRHSMFSSPARGASSRAPRAALLDSDDDTDGPPAPKRRSLRVRPLDSSSKESPSKASTSNKDDSSKESASKPLGSVPAESKELGSKARKARSPRYSEVTRRFAARHRRAVSSTSAATSPAPSRSPSPLLEPNTRSRRLFNPNANV